MTEIKTPFDAVARGKEIIRQLGYMHGKASVVVSGRGENFWEITAWTIDFTDILMTIDGKGFLKKFNAISEQDRKNIERDNKKVPEEIKDDDEVNSRTNEELFGDSYNSAIKTATDFMENDQYDKAIPYLDEHLKEFPNQSQTYFLKGLALTFLDENEAAIGCFESCKQLTLPDTPHSEFYWRYANALYNLDRFYEALEMNGEAIDIDPNDTGFVNGRAHILLSIGLELLEKNECCHDYYFDQSLMYFDKVLEINPEHPNALLGKNALLKYFKKEDYDSPLVCPKCNDERIGRFVYGNSSIYEEFKKELADGTIRYGDNVVGPGQPRWYCMGCDYEW